jgi:hypothetical protein
MMKKYYLNCSKKYCSMAEKYAWSVEEWIENPSIG